ncbi:uncharacterized protein LOC143783488 [Ranitomeya variabilis]|uniref:uncharacterized protein LOC143783488 n=1 Tax=Ranitomeya variabilis TaxID=490064 RepID=UPI004056C2C3
MPVGSLVNGRNCTIVEMINLDLFRISHIHRLHCSLKDFHLFSRKLVLKKLHSGGGHGSDTMGCTEEETLRILEELLDEQTSTPKGFHLWTTVNLREYLKKKRISYHHRV